MLESLFSTFGSLKALVHGFPNSYLAVITEPFPIRPADTSLQGWRTVNSEICCELDSVSEHWWNHSGRALGVLLSQACYPLAAQCDHLRFYARLIAPNLGSFATERRVLSWPSFMTDEGLPIEMSWDWGAAGHSPSIRYSIEPISPFAGTRVDPDNSRVTSEFFGALNRMAPALNTVWFDHFQMAFNVCRRVDTAQREGHQSRIFFAFDLQDAGLMSKAYFFAGRRAQLSMQTNLDAIRTAIHDAPCASLDKLTALESFYRWATRADAPTLEFDMLAIDLKEPASSRLKIYFRCRNASFSSIREIMTLGDPTSRFADETALTKLEQLLHVLLSGYGEMKTMHEAPCHHRTAGILYNIEFRLGDTTPVVKIYIPVRHYSPNDLAVMTSLTRFLAEEGRPPKHINQYQNALRQIFTDEALRQGRGIHTYIGCSISADGSLRLVSYIAPQVGKLK